MGSGPADTGSTERAYQGGHQPGNLLLSMPWRIQSEGGGRLPDLISPQSRGNVKASHFDDLRYGPNLIL